MIAKGSNEWILLSDFERRGGQFRTSGISFERFVAMNCLVSHTIFPSGTKAPEFDSLQLPLSGFEKWLRFGAIKVSHTDGNISTIYERPGDQTNECPANWWGRSTSSMGPVLSHSVGAIEFPFLCRFLGLLHHKTSHALLRQASEKR